MDLEQLKTRLKNEVFVRGKKIRYYSGFNLEGFFLGYDHKTKLFDKSLVSYHPHVWFYLDKKLISSCISFNSGEAVEIGSEKDYLNYFVFNQVMNDGEVIRNSAGTALSRVGSSGIPNYEPCVFSGLISLNEIGYNGNYYSESSIVQVDRLYEIIGKQDHYKNWKIKKINDISHRLN